MNCLRGTLRKYMRFSMTPDYIWDLRHKTRELRTLLSNVPDTVETYKHYVQCTMLLDCLERSIEMITPLVQEPAKPVIIPCVNRESCKHINTIDAVTNGLPVKRCEDCWQDVE